MLLMYEGYSHFETLEVDNDEEDQDSATEGGQVGVGLSGESQHDGAPLVGLGEEEVDEGDEAAFEFDSVFR